MITSRIGKLMVKISVVDLGSCYTVHRYCSHCPPALQSAAKKRSILISDKIGHHHYYPIFPVFILRHYHSWYFTAMARFLVVDLSASFCLFFFPFSTIPNPLHFHFGTAKTSRPSFFPLKQMGIWNPCKRKTIHINLGFHKKILLLFWVNEIERRVSMDLLRP